MKIAFWKNRINDIFVYICQHQGYILFQVEDEFPMIYSLQGTVGSGDSDLVVENLALKEEIKMLQAIVERLEKEKIDAVAQLEAKSLVRNHSMDDLCDYELRISELTDLNHQLQLDVIAVVKDLKSKFIVPFFTTLKLYEL